MLKKADFAMRIPWFRWCFKQQLGQGLFIIIFMRKK